MRLVARETRLSECATLAERTRHEWERLRECDVTVGWAEVEEALARPQDDDAERHTPRINASMWKCTTWPADARVGSDAARCAHGNRQHDGYEYVHNAARGMPGAKCGACACCRRQT